MTGEKAWHSRPRALHGPGVEAEAEGARRGQRVDLEREALLGRPRGARLPSLAQLCPLLRGRAGLGTGGSLHVEFCLGRKSSSLPCALLPVLLGEMRCCSSLAPPFLLCPPSPCGFPPLSWVTHQWPALFLVVWMES